MKWIIWNDLFDVVTCFNFASFSFLTSFSKRWNKHKDTLLKRSFQASDLDGSRNFLFQNGESILRGTYEVVQEDFFRVHSVTQGLMEYSYFDGKLNLYDFGRIPSAAKSHQIMSHYFTNAMMMFYLFPLLILSNSKVRKFFQKKNQKKKKFFTLCFQGKEVM